LVRALETFETSLAEAGVDACFWLRWAKPASGGAWKCLEDRRICLKKRAFSRKVELLVTEFLLLFTTSCFTSDDSANTK